MKIVTFEPGRLFYHGMSWEGRQRPKFQPLVGKSLWMTTDRSTALNFSHGVVAYLRTSRPLRMARFDGRDGYIDLATMVGVEPDDDSLFEAARAFCSKAGALGLDGWHLPSFYGDRASDTMVCDSASALQVERLWIPTEGQRA